MFYSSEILLDEKKYGVATIWLVATLGARSSVKRVPRNKIMKVNVSQACNTIITPTTPMALRLQGSLLYGVSRVFSQQCGYVLDDTQNLRDHMRGVSLSLKEVANDANVVAARPEQLNISIDPNFDINFDMNFDFADFSTTQGSQRSSLNSSHSLRSSRTSVENDIDIDFGEGVVAPSVDTPEEDFDFDHRDLDTDTGTRIHEGRDIQRSSRFDEPGIDEQPGFDIIEDNVVLHNSALTGAAQVVDDLNPTRWSQNEDLVPVNLDIAGNIDDHGEGIDLGYADEDVLALEDDFEAVIDEDTIRAPPFQDQGLDNGECINVDTEVVQSTVTAAAPQRRGRALKTPEADIITQLSNAELKNWGLKYAQNMDEAKRKRDIQLSRAQAKKNAAFWVLGQRLGGTSINFATEVLDHPFSELNGLSLLELLGHEAILPTAKKRVREIPDDSTEIDQDDPDAAERRVRSRSEEPQLSGAEIPIAPAEDEEGLVLGDDTAEPEVGRKASRSLQDRSSDLPWSIFGRKSSIRAMSIPPANSTSAGAGLDVGAGSLPSLERYGSRVTSASPLYHKRVGTSPQMPARYQSLQTDSSNHLDTMEIDAALAQDLDEEYELLGPAADVSTQQAADSQWLNMTLREESDNFYVFLDTAIRAQVPHTSGSEEDDHLSSISFESLLPPEANTNVVAAQGFLHVLSLATRGLIAVEQNGLFSDITMAVV